jgi:hypothetical protein
MEVSGKLHIPAALPPAKEALIPLDRGLSGPQSQSGHGSEEKNSQSLPVLEPSIAQSVAQRYSGSKSLRYPLERRLGGPQARFGRVGEDKNPWPRRQSDPDRPAHNWFIILIELLFIFIVSALLCY